MNLTLLYALLAYSSIKQRDFSGVYVSYIVIQTCTLLYAHTISHELYSKNSVSI